MATKHTNDDHTISYRNNIISKSEQHIEKSDPVTVLYSGSTTITNPGSFSDPQYGFGISTYVSGNVITAGMYGTSGTGAGVYILRKLNGTWTNTALLSASHIDSDGGQYFGGENGTNEENSRPVCVLGNRISVGAPREEQDPSQNHYEGVAYLFNSESSGWARTRLFATASSSSSRYGQNTLLGDNFLAVGAKDKQGLNGSSGNAQGVIFMYDYSTTDGNNFFQLLTSSTRAGSAGNVFLGSTMAFDYKNRILFSAESSSPERAELFASSSTKGWCVFQTISSDAGYSAAQYGYSLDACDDYFVVGAPYDRPGGDTLRGAAFIYKSGSSQYELEHTISGSAAGELLGRSVSITSGSTGIVAIVGSQEDNDDGEDGASQVFLSSSNSGWSLISKMISPVDDGAGYQDDYATSLHSEGDVLVVGSYGESIEGEGSQTGRIYIYEPQVTLNSKTTDAPMRFNSNGPFNIRLQSNTSAYKTFLGEQKS